jgi:hypothetical protein
MLGREEGGNDHFPRGLTSPFGVTVVTDKGYKAVQSGDRKALKKEDILLTEDSKDPALEGKVTLPAGSSWFIIENRTDKKVEIHLQCFAVPTPVG